LTAGGGPRKRAPASRYKMGMRLVVVVLATVLALAPAAGAASATASERALVACANDARAARGLEPLKVDRALHSVAHRFAADMARRGFFDHVDPDGRDPGDRIEVKGRYITWGENIAEGYPDAAATCRGWLRSRGHRRNILDRHFTRIGAGYADGGDGPVFVQDFGAKAGDSER
jgi:uncharacterized protein YkwD